MRFYRSLCLIILAGMMMFSSLFWQASVVESKTTTQPALASNWTYNIRRWSPQIETSARRYRLDPDLVAAVVWNESNGFPEGVSYAGAVGLMGIMPHGPGFEFRPTSEKLLNPVTNVNWGCAILADIIQQSGGDVHAALAAYNGGWYYANYPVPRTYSADVLDDYGRAIATSVGIDPDSAERWGIALEIQSGYISAEPYLLGGQKVSEQELELIGGRIAYHGHNYFVKAYAVALR